VGFSREKQEVVVDMQTFFRSDFPVVEKGFGNTEGAIFVPSESPASPRTPGNPLAGFWVGKNSDLDYSPVVAGSQDYLTLIF
jgi:hypothetical protein